MAIRTIRTIGDDILTKKCKVVKEMTPRIRTLIEDMFDTMAEAQGVGLAAPQVGILKRIAVIDDYENEQKYVLINPVIIETEGEQTGQEGCLSVPGKAGDVTRPMKATVEAYDKEMKKFTLTGEGLLARAICHETEHLDGELYVDKAIGGLYDVMPPEEAEEEE